MNFGSYAIFDTVTYKFSKEPGWFWKIKAPNALDQLEMNRLIHEQRTQTRQDVTTTVPLVYLEIAIKEISLTFAGTNVPGGEGLNRDTVSQFLCSMPVEMVWELWDAVGAAVPTWGPPEDPKNKKDIQFEETKPKND